METTSSSNKRIAKNTFFLYLRMILTLGVSLYTSRIVLNTLGVEDFGIYNLVGGIVVLFSFINGSMTSATQRFLNFEMGKGDRVGVHKVFCISMNTYFIISLIIIILAETIGLWFLNNKLNIPLNRMEAANVVYQFSILTFIVNILKVPYNASIIAYEKMSFYAWSSIAEVVLKLVIVFILVFFMLDKLILYSALTFAVSVFMYMIYRAYSRRKFTTCKYEYMKDNKVIKELLSFSGWSMLGNVAVIGANQGIAMIMNIFIGVTINAAMGVASQVNSALFGFVSNFQRAFNPQIVKTYASNELEEHKHLLFQASRFSYFLLLILAIPVLFNTEYILTVWLKIVPTYTVIITQLIIIASMLEALSGPFWMSTGATGRIKYYQLIVSILIFIKLPFAYVVLYNGLSPAYVFVGHLIVSFLIYLFRMVYVKRYLKFTLADIVNNLIVKVLIVTILTVVSMLLIKYQLMPQINTALSAFLFTTVSICLSVLYVLILGISKSEKRMIIQLLFYKFKK